MQADEQVFARSLQLPPTFKHAHDAVKHVAGSIARAAIIHYVDVLIVILQAVGAAAWQAVQSLHDPLLAGRLLLVMPGAIPWQVVIAILLAASRSSPCAQSTNPPPPRQGSPQPSLR